MAERNGPSRELALAVLGGLAAGGLALYAAGRAWVRLDVVATGMPRVPVEVTGTAAVPWTGALALVVIAASLALLPTGGLLRRGIALLATLAATGVVIGVLVAGGALEETLRADVLASPASAGLDPAALLASAEHTAWRWVTLVAGLLAMLIGAWATVRAPGWPVMGSRYEAPAVARSTPPAQPTDVDDLPETDLWRSMDRGDDPTAR